MNAEKSRNDWIELHAKLVAIGDKARYEANAVAWFLSFPSLTNGQSRAEFWKACASALSR